MNVVFMLLIVIGGIGFLTWEDVCTHRFRLHRYRLQSKVILVTAGALIIFPAVLFFFNDFSALPLKQRIPASLFQSVTTRTAGFNTVDLNAMSEVSRSLMVFLMLTGGAPGSTAGGMKVTTIAVLVANAVSTFRENQDTELFRRRLEPSAVRNAATVFLLYQTLCFVGAAVISLIEKLPFATCVFETASAVGTVGLTLGITPQLGAASQWLIAALMFLGRVGGLTLIYAAFSVRDNVFARYPQEKITVG